MSLTIPNPTERVLQDPSLPMRHKGVFPSQDCAGSMGPIRGKRYSWRLRFGTSPPVYVWYRLDLYHPLPLPFETEKKGGGWGGGGGRVLSPSTFFFCRKQQQQQQKQLRTLWKLFSAVISVVRFQTSTYRQPELDVRQGSPEIRAV